MFSLLARTKGIAHFWADLLLRCPVPDGPARANGQAPEGHGLAEAYLKYFIVITMYIAM